MIKVFGNIETGEVEIVLTMDSGVSMTATMSPEAANYYADLIIATTKTMKAHTPEKKDG